MSGRPLARISRVLGIGRTTACRELERRARQDHRRDDAVVYAQLKAVLRERGSYGYHWATVLVNRAYRTGCNRKRIQRVMRLRGLVLAVRHRRRNGWPHRGVVTRPGSNQCGCSDKLNIACWNGEVDELTFAVDGADLSTATATRARIVTLRM